MTQSAHTEQPAIEFEEIKLVLGGRTILDGLNLAIPSGQVTALMGPSGAGKTTLLRLITGQLKPDHGRVVVNGTIVNELSPKELNQYRKNVGVLLQNGALFTDLTVFDNIALPLREHTELDESLIRRVVLLKLHTVGLRGAAQLYPRELSGGMNRRIAMARAMALDPGLMLYDEPFAGLDPISMGISLRLIRQVNEALGMTSIVVTHDVHEVSKLAHLACIIAHGNIIAAAPPAELAQSQEPLVRQFMQGLPDGPVAFHYPAPDLSEDLLNSEEHHA